jgi:hypothetical protein
MSNATNHCYTVLSHTDLGITLGSETKTLRDRDENIRDKD